MSSLKLFKSRIILISVILSGLFIVILTMPGCGKKQGNTYSIYYRNAAGNKLTTLDYVTSTKNQNELVKELFDQMGKFNKKDDCMPLKPDNVTMEKYEILKNVLYVYLNKDYDLLEPTEVLLLRAGLVKMFTQIEGIEYIRFYVDGSPATYNDGSFVGLMSPSDFVDDSNDNLESVEWKKVTLYYANKLGTRLVKKSETIAVGKSTSVERILVEDLIKGPSNPEMSGTLPSTLKVLSVSVSERVCYVNLSSAFINEMVNVSNEIPIYSIVNTLCDQGNIDSVKIMINGDSSKSYREVISLENTFSFNSDIVEPEE